MKHGYYYLDKSGKPLLKCPDCGRSWLEKDSLLVMIQVLDHELEFSSQLTPEGLLVDSPKKHIANGYHSGTLCNSNHDNNLLCDMEGVVETLAGTKVKVYGYVDCSTAHISREDHRQLHEDAQSCDDRIPDRSRRLGDTRLIVFEYDSGYFIHTSIVEDEDGMVALRSRYSQTLLDLIAESFEEGAIFLRLELGGEVYPDIQQYDW